MRFNSTQFLLINVPGQQPDGQLQNQQNTGKNITKDTKQDTLESHTHKTNKSIINDELIHTIIIILMTIIIIIIILKR